MIEQDAGPIPLLRPTLPDANRLLPWLRKIDAAHWYSNFGPLVREFEARIGELFGSSAPDTPVVVSLASGTAPLELGLAAMRLPPGSAVLLPAFTFPATAGAVVRNGLRPVFCDVDPHTWCLTPDLARAALAHVQAAAILPVATFGVTQDVDAWDALAEEAGVRILIDAAGAFGNQRPGRHCALAFSFHATKPFGIGEGGALVCHDAQLAGRVRVLSNFGFSHGMVEAVGTNAKLSEYAAAVGLAQCERWPQLQARRHALWQKYAAMLASIDGIRLQQGAALPGLPANVVVRVAGDSEHVVAALARQGIETRRWYCPPLHRHPAFAHHDLVGADGGPILVATEALAHSVVGLPWYAEMTPVQCRRVAVALEACVGVRPRDSSVRV
ncbi:DegT/DnrJ/EryC1/StrS family aminotransferase [Azoarcus sp. L1K30]|uniref:DegT/DnrJ/EryC1/StrS family aminotransferase n=1 Tax=Azoarcus sp. L1K30 TaxID=2820277 RepID=UPI001B83194C|nr:DegT/DnrJ/EryC1/StrS family aminotransferase [Azoarcus sp. L1K30]